MKKYLYITLALVILSVPLMAQEQTGVLGGKVTTTDDKVVVGAKVVLSGKSLMRNLISVTNDKGRFRFPRIPIGTYKLTVTADQYKGFEQDGIEVNIGATVSINPVLEVGSFEELVVISGEAPIIDVESTDVGEVITQELISKLPMPRFPSDALGMTPGAIGNDSVTLGGSSYGNAYKLDGIDVSDPQTHTVWVFVNMESIEEMEVLPIAGASADVGGFTGAAINMVTRSGGNEFSGGFAYYYFNDSFLQRNGDDDYLFDNTYRPAMNNDVTGFLGGPIAKDRIWFFGNLGWRKTEHVYGEDFDSPATREYRNNMLKVTSTLTDTMTLNGTWHYDNYLREKRDWGFNHADEASVDQEGPNKSFAIEWIWAINDNNMLDAKFHGWDGYFALLNNGSGPQIYDIDADWVYGSSGYDYRSDRQRMQFTSNLNTYVDEFYGEHNFKFGYDYSRGKAVENDEWDYIEIYGGVNDYRENYFDLYYEGLTIGHTFYATDSWTVNDRLHINAGLRYEKQTANSPDFTLPSGGSVSGVGDIHTFDNIAPRFGFTYKLNEAGTFLLRGSAGRYFETLAVGLLEDFLPVTSVWTEYFWDGADWVSYYTEPMGADTSVYTIDNDLGQTFTDAFTLGFEYDLGKSIGLGVDYMYRTQKDFVVNWDQGFTWNPVSVEHMGQTYQLFERSGDPQYLITNSDDRLYADYQALIIRLTKRYSDNWQLQSSLTISELKGTAASISGSSRGQVLGGLDFYEDPNNQINREGLLGGHRPILLKVNGTYTFPFDISLSTIATYNSGRRWSPQSRVSGLAQGRVYFLTQERGTYGTYDNQFMIDLRTEKTFAFDRYKVQFLLDIYNLFNTATVNDIEERTYASDFDEAEGHTHGRYFQVGFRFTF